MQTIAELVQDADALDEYLSQQTTNGHTWTFDAKIGAENLPPQFTVGRRRLRMTYEWSNLTLLLMAGSHSMSVAANVGKHDGTGTHKKYVLNVGEFGEIVPRSTGLMKLDWHIQAGQRIDGGWSQGFFTGFCTIDDTPDHMGGDYFYFTGKFATGGPDFKMASYGGETGKVTAVATWDWPQ